MKKSAKLLLLSLITLVAIVIVAMMKPIPQDPAFHTFADRDTIFGIPNFANVLSNLPFLLTGITGLSLLKRSVAPRPINTAYAVIFISIILTGLGSAWYHLSPDNNSLVYDRIPMTLVFMAFLSITIAECIDRNTGTLALFPLLLLGVSSVLWWHFTEQRGAGDLRFYAFIQFFPMIIIPVIFLLFRSPENTRGLSLLAWVIGWYIIAKLSEHFDENILTACRVISGHSLKHIAAAIATWYIVKFFKTKYINSGTAA